MTNKHIRNLIFLILLLLLPISGASVHAQNIIARNIPLLDKLPVKAIHRIFQDSEGYMWYGTFNGLCRSDGYNIRVFRSDLYHPGLLSDNYITYIAEDYHKKIWFGTMKGGYILDKRSYQLTRIDMQELTDMNVFSINVTRDETIWISVPGALFRFNKDGTLLKRYPINQPSGCIYFVYEDKENNLLISVTEGGMYILDKEKDTFLPYHHHPDYMSIERIIWDDEHHCYWLGTWGKGIVRFTPDNLQENSQYTPQPLPIDITGKPTGAIYHMVQDDTFKYIWVTAWNDLYAFRITEKSTLEQINTSSFLTPGNKILYEIYKDREGKLWVSAFDMESFIIDIRQNITQEYSLPDLIERTKATPNIISLHKEPTENIFWFTQDRYGLCMYNTQTEKLKYYTDCKEVRQLPFWATPNIFPSQKEKRVWVIPQISSTIYGLTRKEMEMLPEIHISLHDISQNPGYVTTTFETTDERLWIGSSTGLFIYYLSKGILKGIPKVDGHVTCITQTTDGKVWIALKNKGIYSFNNEKLVKQYSFDKDFVCMASTSDGKLWLGTSEGEILSFNPKQEKTLTDYSRVCGMNGDIINNIIVDNYNHIWIVTNHAIKEFNPRNGAYRTYTTHDPEFLIRRFFPQAISYNAKGEIYFGGIGGVIAIPPTQQLESIPQQVTTYITDIKVMGKSISGSTDYEFTQNNLIKITPDDQNLEIEFSSLDFHNLKQIRYAYRLIGVDKDWIYLNEGKNSAFYNKLDKGKYTFQVKATDKNGLWSDKITQLTIHRLPAFYETWWAYLFYLLATTTLAGYCLYTYLKREKRKHDEIWTDSQEMIKMRTYLNSEVNLPEAEFKRLDKLLLDKAIKIVENHLAETNFDVTALAEAMNMSRSTFTRKIKSITGKTPLDFIRDIKMQYAREMLESKTASITDVIIALGYSDHKNFTNTFKKAFGMTPSEYQRKSLGQNGEA